MFSAALKRPLNWVKPMALSIEPINVCNLKCPECPTGLGSLTRAKGMVTVDSFKAMLAGIDKSLWHLNLYFQGEPYMHPDFFALVQQAKKNRLVVETSTNGQFLSYQQAQKTVKSGLDILVVSLDGTTQEVYEKYRIGGDLDKVIDAIKNLVRAKKEARAKFPIIRAQFLAFNHNQHQIEQFEHLAWELGVDEVEIKKAQIYDVDNKKNMLPTKGDLSRYKLLHDDSVQLKGKIRNKCWKHWSSAVVTWKGDVVPCCFDKDADNLMGILQEDTLNAIWANKKYNDFRKRILVGQQHIDICKNCPLSRS